MTLSATEAAKLNFSGAVSQDTAIGTELQSTQTAVTNIQAGIGITLPTSDPGVAGQLWADTGTVKVSAG